MLIGYWSIPDQHAFILKKNISCTLDSNTICVFFQYKWVPIKYWAQWDDFWDVKRSWRNLQREWSRSLLWTGENCYQGGAGSLKTPEKAEQKPETALNNIYCSSYYSIFLSSYTILNVELKTRNKNYSSLQLTISHDLWDFLCIESTSFTPKTWHKECRML